MRILRHVFAGLVGLTLSAGAASATGGVDDPGRQDWLKAVAGKKVVLIPQAGGMDLAQGWAHFVGDWVKANGGTFEVRDPNWSAEAGAQAITNEIAAKPDVLVIHNPDLQSYAKLVKRAQQAGIYVIQVENLGATRSDVFVGSDWYNVGKLEGEAVAKACGPGTSGKVGLVQGDLVSSGSLDEYYGSKAVFDEHSNITVVAKPTTDWDTTKAKNVTATMLQQNPDLCGIVDFWDATGQGTAAAIHDAGKTDKIFLVTNGGGEQADCDALASGAFSALVSTEVQNESRDITDAIQFLLQSGQPPGSVKMSIFTPERITNKADLQPDTCWKQKDFTSK